MRQVIFPNGDVAEVSEKSNHLYIIYENVAPEDPPALITLDPSVWNSFTIRRSNMGDLNYESHVLDHVEYDGKNVSFALREMTEEDENKAALEILLGGMK